MGGSVASSVSSYSEHNGGAADLNSLRPGGEEEFLDESRAWLTGVFGVLYTVSKEKDNHTVLFAAFRLFMDWLQLFLLTVAPAYGFDINDKNLGWRIFNFIQLNQFMSARGLAFFLACLYVLVAALLANIAMSVWVGWSFHNNRFDHVWPIKFLRYFATIFYQVLDIASMTLFLMTLDCSYFGRPEGVRFYNQEFPDVYCWSMPHLIHVVVAVVSLIVFITMAGLFTMAEMELNPVTKNLMAMGHSKVELVGFAIKVIMTCSSVFITSGKWCSAVQLIMAGLLTFLYLRWVPHYYNLVNHVRVATYASVFFSALMWVILAFDLGVKNPDDPDEVHAMSKRISIITWVGVVPVAGLGWLASWMRLRHFHGAVLDRFRNASHEEKPKEIYEVTDARQVEILGRCCRVWVDMDNLDKEAIALAAQVMKCGMQQLPKDPYMIIIYSSFLIDVELSYQSGYKLLQTAKKADPSILERFAIFSREQQHTQKAAGGAAGQAIDLVSYVEFQRNYGLAMKVHKEALLAARAFWACLLHHNIKFTALTKAIRRMDKANKQAERVYRQVLQRHATNVKMVRLYAKFLEGVKHDPWNAAKWASEAERLEAAEDLAKANNMLEGLDADPTLRAALMSDQWQAHGIIIVNAESSIQMANQTAQEVLGYGKGEMRGRNCSIIIPPPIADNHASYIKRYIDSGKAAGFLDKWNTLGVLHKERHLVPLSIKVTKVSGIGEDTVFMAVFKSLPLPPDRACIWLLPSGRILSADHHFFDWFGYKAADIAGMGLDVVVKEHEGLEEVLEDLHRGIAPSHHADTLPSPRVPPHRVSNDGPPSYSFLVPNKGNRGPKQRQAPPLDGTSTYGRAATLLDGSLDQAPNSPGPANPSRTMQLMHCCHVHHKYLDDVEVDLTITYASMGSQHFYSVQLRRTGPLAAPYLIVTDTKGRIVHVTDQVLQLLGTTRSAFSGLTAGQGAGQAGAAAGPGAGAVAPGMMGPGAVGPLMAPGGVMGVVDGSGGLGGLYGKQMGAIMMVEQLMLEPFASLHKHAGPATNPHFAMSLTTPAYSCRSGLSVLMPCNTRRGPDATAVRMSIQRRGTAEGAFHVMSLEPRTLEQASDERCLRLVVDCLGVVQEASSGTPKSLFGLEPRRLVGRSLSSFVDVFQQGGEDDDLGINDDAIDLLVDLVKHARQFPGAAFNVGVLAPPPTSTRIPESMQPLLQANRTHAAVMTVSMILEQPSKGPAPGAQPAAPNASRAPAGGSPAPARPLPTSRFAQHLLQEVGALGHNGQQSAHSMRDLDHSSSAHGEDQAPVTRHLSYPGGPGGAAPQRRLPSTSNDGVGAVGFLAAVEQQEVIKQERKLQQQQQQQQDQRPVSQDSFSSLDIPDPRIEIRLYRSDLITSVVEVDAAGKVAFLPDRPEAFTQLYNGGLVFGSQDPAMLGSPLSRYLHISSSMMVSDLFEPMAPPKGIADPNAGAGEEDTVVKPKSTIKIRQTGVKPVGPANILRTRQVGGLPLELPVTVQAVRKVWPANGTYLVIHPHEWPCGRPDFLAWLRANSTALNQQAPKSRGHGGGGSVLMVPVRSFASLSIGPDGYPTSTNMIKSATAVAGLSRNPSHTGLAVPVVGDGIALTPPAVAGSSNQGVPALVPAPAPAAVVVTGEIGLPGAAPLRPGSSGEGAPRDLDSDEVMRHMADGNKTANNSDDAGGAKGKGVAFANGSGASSGGADDGEGDVDAAAGGGDVGGGSDEEREVPKGAKAKMNKSGREDLIAAWVLSNGSSYPLGHQGSMDGAAGGAAAAAVAGKGVRIEPVGVMFSADGTGHGPLEPLDELQEVSSQEGGQAQKSGGPAARKAKGTLGFGGVEAQEAAASDKGTEDDVLTDAEGFTGENLYRRGRRYKKLLRIMSTSQVQTRLNRFKLHTILIVLALMGVHAGMFIMMFFLIKQQKFLLQMLYYISQSADAAADVVLHVRQLNAYYSRELYPNLIGLSDINELTDVHDSFIEAIDYFREMHAGAYLGYNGSNTPLPDTNGVRHMWEFPEFNETVFWYTYTLDAVGRNVSSVESRVQGASLWDVGNKYVAHAYNYWQNSIQLYNGTYPETNAAHDLDLLYMVNNYRDVIVDGYLDTMDGMVQYIIDSANKVNQTQIIILVLEGVCLCLVAVAYVWYLASKVTSERFKVYSIFMAVPQGLIRSLATKKMNLDPENGEEEDDQDVVLQQQQQQQQQRQAGAGGGGGKSVQQQEEEAPARPFGMRRASEGVGGGSGTFKKLPTSRSMRSSQDFGDYQPGFWAGLKAFCCACISGSKPDPSLMRGKKPKRKLVASHTAAAWQIILFLLWGALVIACNGIGNALLSQISSPVATFIILNFCMVIYVRNVHFMQEMVFQPSDPVRQAQLRQAFLRHTEEMKKEYKVLLFGRKIVPNETKPHYTLVEDGLLFTDTQVTDLFFKTNDCILINDEPELCLPEDHPLYKWSVGGLDRMAQHAFELADTLTTMTGLEPAMNSTLFDYYWNLGDHVGSGFDVVDKVYYQFVVGVYDKVMTVHIVALVITLIIFLAFAIFIMRPFIHEVRSETPRIAELLIELPSEINVEGLLSKTINNSGGASGGSGNKVVPDAG